MQTQPSPGGPSRRAVVAGLLGAALAAGCEGSDGGARETPSAGGAAPTGTATGSVTTSPAASGAPQRLRMGVNYVPSEHWWYSWTNWRPSSLAADLESIASLGLDHIRIMCMWPEFQPNQAFVSAELISRLVTLLDLADDAGLDVEVTVFNGAVSGFLFLPSWLLDRAGDPMVRDFLTDPGILDAERALLTALAKAVGRHPRFLGFDLSNELHWAVIPTLGRVHPVDGDAWHTAMFAHAERVAPGKLHVSGIDHHPWLSGEVFSREGLATSGTATAVHTWPGWTEVIQTYGPLSTPSVHYSEYYVEFVKAFHTDPGRRVWLEETGISRQWAPLADHPEWAERTIRNAASCGNLLGVTWWCSHDLNPDLTGFVALEYDLGLMTNDRRVKSLGRRVARLAGEYADTPPRPMERPVALAVPDGTGSGAAFLEPFMRLVEAGVRPAVVLASRATDAEYLASRGIEQVLTLDEVP